MKLSLTVYPKQGSDPGFFPLTRSLAEILVYLFTTTATLKAHMVELQDGGTTLFSMWGGKAPEIEIGDECPEDTAELIRATATKNNLAIR